MCTSTDVCSWYQEQAVELEAVGNLSQVRSMLPMGCQRCEDSEDIPTYFTYTPTSPSQTSPG